MPKSSFSELFSNRDSNLPVERYHLLSDATMDTLWESLEELLDAEGDQSYEVEYSVRPDLSPHYAWPHEFIVPIPERSAYA